MRIPDILFQAQHLFQNRMKWEVDFVTPVVLKEGLRSTVLRCQVQPPSPSNPSIPASIIIKHIQSDEARGFSDWASLEFLSALPEVHQLGPRFYAGHVEQRLFVMEDLGSGDSLQDLFTAGRPLHIHPDIGTLASQMARLHTTTYGRQEEFEELGRAVEARQWQQNSRKLGEWFSVLDYVPPSGFERCLTSIAALYSDPGEFLSFTQGDSAPIDNFFVQGQARLLDFEYAGYRHTLYDITVWNILCALPRPSVDHMTHCFREALAPTLPTVGDDEKFEREWAYLCAYRALAVLTWISPDVLQHAPPGHPTGRIAKPSSRLCPGSTETHALRKLGLPKAEEEALRQHINTLVPIARLGTPLEIAKAAVFLTSDESTFMVGSEQRVDGGVGNV